MSIIEVIKQKITEKIIDSVWVNILIISSPTIISTYTAYLTDTINIYAPFSYFIAVWIGVLITLKIYGFKRDKQYKTSAEIRLRYHGNTHTPDELLRQNTWRWYNLIHMDYSNNLEVLANCLFLSFDKPVAIGTLKITSPDMKLPLYEVKEYNNRFAIIFFSGQLPSGTLVVSSFV
jgi:hypothetical protein